MYKKDKIIITCLFFIVFSIVFLCDFRVRPSFLGGVIAFGGIIFGFLISSISTLFGSEFIRHLSECEDHNQPIHCTQLQILKQYFYVTSLVSFSVMLLSLTAEVLSQCKIICKILIPLIVVDVFLTWKIVKILLRGLEEEVTKH